MSQQQRSDFGFLLMLLYLLSRRIGSQKIFSCIHFMYQERAHSVVSFLHAL